MITRETPRTYDGDDRMISGFSAFSGPRKCASCRYYRDAGVASSGWCTHPRRGELRDLVLVRGADLSCRDHQDRDLWEPGPEPQRGPQLRIVPAEPSDEAEWVVTPARVVGIWPGAACKWPKCPPPVRRRLVITERIEEVA